MTISAPRVASLGESPTHCDSVTMSMNPTLHLPASPHLSSPAPSAPPQKVTCESTGSTTVRVSWVPPPADSRNGIITQYSLAYEAVDGEDRGRHVVDGISREHSSWDLVGLEKWTEYRVWVRAHTDVGPGPESSPVLVRTDEDGRQPCQVGLGKGDAPSQISPSVHPRALPHTRPKPVAQTVELELRSSLWSCLQGR